MFPKTLKQLEDLIVRIWAATLKRLRSDLDNTTDRVEVTEEDIVVIEEDVEENTEEILATKEELQEVKDLVALLVLELTILGIDLHDEKLLNLLENSEIKI